MRLRRSSAYDDYPFRRILIVFKRAAIDAGATFINSGAFYGNSEDGGLDNLRLLNRFFKANPGYEDKVVISVKGGMRGGKLMHGPDSR